MRISGSLFASSLLLSAVVSATDSNPGFRILSPEEISRHQQALAQRQGEKREQYRNRVYADLVERARAQGFEMPAAPPWPQAAGSTAQFRPDSAGQRNAEVLAVTNTRSGPAASGTGPAQPGNPADKPDMPTLVARQKRVIEEAVQQQLNDDRKTAQKASQTASSPSANAADLYREKMRKRFDDFMARREARQRQAESPSGQPPLKPPSVTAPGGSAEPPAMVQPQPYPVPPTPWGMPAMPGYPQPAYPPAPQPYYPQPLAPQATQPPPYPQAGPPGIPPFGYPPRAPGWY